MKNKDATQNHQECFNSAMMFIVYRHLLLQENIMATKKYMDELIKVIKITKNKNKENSNFERFLKPLTNNQKTTLIECLSRQKEYVPIIQQYLVKWEYKRLPAAEKAILLLATHYIQNNLAADILVINVSLNLIKKFCEYRNYAYVNAVLDNIYKAKGEITT